MVFSRGRATLHLAVSVGKSVRPYVTFLNSEQFLRYCSCPTVRDWIAVYPALLIEEPRIMRFKRLRDQQTDRRMEKASYRVGVHNLNKAGYTAIQSRTVGQEQ